MSPKEVEDLALRCATLELELKRLTEEKSSNIVRYQAPEMK